ncbi:MAG: hypothetical protein I3273_03615 [Candidatus Moeniiplasma glomeromycotorum]|nr:hypothetical protein [Candidatus Moeniiplasma glomeromycotorum]MCE8169184.1 hypothetical protein [Candidatus Moeniiplasma glomeromycotorum]
MSNNNNNKKELANLIKADLQKDLEEAKKSSKHFSKSWEKSLGESCSEPRGNEWRLTYFSSDKNKWKERKSAREGWIEFFPEQLETDDWKEIENLIQQIKKLKEEEKEKKDQKSQEEQAKIDQKLKENPNLFVYEFTDEIWGGTEDEVYHFFLGYQNGQKINLKIRWNHPDSKNIFNKDRGFGYSEKHGHFFNVKGFENILLQKYGHADDNSDFSKYAKETYPNYFKNIELTDKITITEFKEKPEKERPDENKPNNEKKENKNIPIPNSVKEYFQKNSNVKSIKLASGKIIIKYNDNSTATDILTNLPELKELEKYSPSNSDITINRQELGLENENSNTNSTNKPQNNNRAYWIGGGILVIVGLGLLFIVVRSKKKKSIVN